MDAINLKQLEDAARAAGYSPIRLTDDGTALLLEGMQQPWNPRDENPHSDCMGDALRLAVKLNITIKVYGANTMCYDMDDKFLADHVDAENPYAATRLAIVRAAAIVQSQQGSKP